MKTLVIYLFLLVLVPTMSFSQNSTGYLHTAFSHRNYFQLRLPGFIGANKNIEKNSLDEYSYNIALHYSLIKKNHLDLRVGLDMGRTELYIYDCITKYWTTSNYAHSSSYQQVQSNTHDFVNPIDVHLSGRSWSFSTGMFYDLPTTSKKVRHNFGLSAFLGIQYFRWDFARHLSPIDNPNAVESSLIYSENTNTNNNQSTYFEGYPIEGEVEEYYYVKNKFSPSLEISYEMSFPIRQNYFPTLGVNAGYYPKMFPNNLSGSRYYSLSLKFSVFGEAIHMKGKGNQLRLRKSAKNRTK